MPSKLSAALLLAGSLVLASAGDRFWTKTPEDAWTPQEVSKFITDSPWAKQVTAVLVSNNSNMAAPGAVRGGGRGRGTRTTSGVPSPDALPKWPALVRWVSAKPMQRALKLHLPDNLQGRYVISVTGLPVGGDANQIAEQTTLQLKHRDAVHPESAYQDPADTATFYFAFVPSTADVTSARAATFDMIAPPYEVKVHFSLAEMKYQGEPAF